MSEVNSTKNKSSSDIIVVNKKNIKDQANLEDSDFLVQYFGCLFCYDSFVNFAALFIHLYTIHTDYEFFHTKFVYGVTGFDVGHILAFKKEKRDEEPVNPAEDDFFMISVEKITEQFCCEILKERSIKRRVKKEKKREEKKKEKNLEKKKEKAKSKKIERISNREESNCEGNRPRSNSLSSRSSQSGSSFNFFNGINSGNSNNNLNNNNNLNGNNLNNCNNNLNLPKNKDKNQFKYYKDKDEGEKVFYHWVTGTVMEKDFEESDYEIDNEDLEIQTARKLNSYNDICDSDKEFILLWNVFVRSRK